MTARTIPLDPDSPKGKEVAERLGNILAEIELAIAERELAAKRLTGTQQQLPAA